MKLCGSADSSLVLGLLMDASVYQSWKPNKTYHRSEDHDHAFQQQNRIAQMV